MTLDQYSVLSLYSAMAVYALAFIAYALDLARRSAAAGSASAGAEAVPAAQRRERALAGGASTAGTGGAGAGEAPTTGAGDSAGSVASVDYGRSPSLRAAVALTVIGWALHLAATVLRGIAAERVPWANMYEFAMTGTLVIVTVYLGVLLFSKFDLRFLGTFIVGLVLVSLGVASVNFYVSVVPLPPALQSAWLIIHVFVATAAVGFFALGFALSLVQLLQSRREAAVETAKAAKLSFLATLPNSDQLERLAYRVNIIGFILWTFTLMAGAIWAEAAWGRYWGWDTKEVWTFIIWVVYAGYIHARATRGWRGSRSAWLAIIGFSAVLFNFTVVNLFFKGLHAYSGL
ncbi:c-type cytochrome biogenesis protein CcsB [Agromyces rhizosphaerae]|uniref:C-type cytochrome biogenesis protein CcsB n=1 Tax=Agromyces rhizosphaerae TaxID=88374 RepID=A0A9W6FR88_9MICO|nr:c-type cytochrome biogenesis protein CcsB [Agromyces rhizosphaerae]